ncbi:MAG: DUF3298 and DUF4163 domain-containing protein [Firmicutes bacterium]|nr:DUF3298 and DUF4163 domain-containing protein [Bacillota bacterium]
MKERGDNAAQIAEKMIVNECTHITYPQVVNLRDSAAQNKINEAIERQVYSLIPPEGCDVWGEIFGKYRVTLNDRGILSVNIQFYKIRQHAANGLNMQKSVTADLDTGKVYKLYELFKRNSDYRIVLNKMIREQIKEKNLHLIKEFKGIDDYQDFYLTEDALVIYWQELEYTIHAEGIPEFVIPYEKIQNLISEDSPIVRFI